MAVGEMNSRVYKCVHNKSFTLVVHTSLCLTNLPILRYERALFLLVAGKRKGFERKKEKTKIRPRGDS